MAHSRKKYPVITDNGAHKKRQKKAANRCTRQKKEIPDGGAYRKFYESWNIRDYRFFTRGPKDTWRYRAATTDEEKERAINKWKIDHLSK